MLLNHTNNLYNTVNGGIRTLSLTPLLYILAAYLTFNTGIFSDDYRMSEGQNMDFGSLAATPVLIVVRSIFYNFITLGQYYLFEIVKTIYVLISMYMISNFFNYFHERKLSLLISFGFIFYITHESTTFFFTGQYLLWSAALYMYACGQGLRQNYTKAVLFSFLGSFISYGSTPFALGLSLLCYLKKDRKDSYLHFELIQLL